MFNGQYDDGFLTHENYSNRLNLYGDSPTSGETTIVKHEQKIVLPQSFEPVKKLEIDKLENKEQTRKRRLGRGFLAVQSVETI